jgi:hypothetical protein
MSSFSISGTRLNIQERPSSVYHDLNATCPTWTHRCEEAVPDSAASGGPRIRGQHRERHGSGGSTCDHRVLGPAAAHPGLDRQSNDAIESLKSKYRIGLQARFYDALLLAARKLEDRASGRQ